MIERLHVYYGDRKRWDQASLDCVQSAVGKECDGFDGLQADFSFGSADEALSALLFVRRLGIRCEYKTVGEGPSAEGYSAARNALRK